MRIVAALGGSALLRRGEPPTIETQRYNAQRAANALARIAREHTLIVTHGNGPQVGLLASQGLDAKTDVYPLDVLGAESEGMIGYLLEQELANALDSRKVATLLTRTEVRRPDPAFTSPTKFVGPIYRREDAERMAKDRGWSIAADGQSWRRVVPAPEPIDIVELGAIEHLSGGGFLVICAGGGVPVCRSAAGTMEGVEAVVDKDLAAALLARRLGADLLLLLTDVPAVFDGWGTASARAIRHAHPDALAPFHFAATSMGPKVEAARRFALHGGGVACIGSLNDAYELLTGRVGTRVCTDIGGISFERPVQNGNLSIA